MSRKRVLKALGAFGALEDALDFMKAQEAKRPCQECFRDPAGEDGFCSDYCAKKYRELTAPDEGGEEG